MNLLILGKKGIAIQGDLEKDLDNSWNIFNWEPSESPDKLVNFLETADVAITGSDALIYGNIFKYISSSKKLKLLQIPCLLYTSPSPRDRSLSRMPSSA